MSTSTGITGGEYLLNETTLRGMADRGVNAATAEKLKGAGYVVNDAGLEALAGKINQATADEFRALQAGATFSTRRKMEKALKGLKKNRIRSTRDRKAAALFKSSVLDERFPDETAFRAALVAAGIDAKDYDALVREAYTGWIWTSSNVKLLFQLPSSLRFALNTALYVALTLTFNIGLGLFLAISTFYTSGIGVLFVQMFVTC